MFPFAYLADWSTGASAQSGLNLVRGAQWCNVRWDGDIDAKDSFLGLIQLSCSNGLMVRRHRGDQRLRHIGEELLGLAKGSLERGDHAGVPRRVVSNRCCVEITRRKSRSRNKGCHLSTFIGAEHGCSRGEYTGLCPMGFRGAVSHFGNPAQGQAHTQPLLEWCLFCNP